MRAALAAALVLLALPGVAGAAPAPVAVGTFEQPVHVTSPPGDAARLFVVEKPGRVQVVVNGQRAATPFLDIAADVNEQTANERGLLSIAFPPDYATSGLFYVFYTAEPIGDLTVMQGRRSANDPNVADPAYRQPLFTIPHSATNHNGGQLAFGPDGALYVSTGDGASGPNAQDLNSRLGKILRVQVGSAPTVHALGLRNPWRFSFDRLTGDLFIGDVGQGTQEEVDRIPAGTPAQLNFGWPDCEGTSGSCAGFTAPILTLSQPAYRSVVGGVVVRDAGLPTLAGRYVFGDHFQSSVLSARTDGSDFDPVEELPVQAATAVSEDGCGHVHVASINGPVYRIQDGALAPCGLMSVPPGGPPPAGPPPAADRTACVLRVGGHRRAQRIVRRGKRLRLRLRADEPCRATLRAKRFKTKRVRLAADVTRTVRLQPTRKGLRKLRRAREQAPRVRIRVRIGTRDAAGNRDVKRVTPRVR